MSRTKNRRAGIIFLAYFHRYICPLLILVSCIWGLLAAGIAAVFYAVYSLAGYMLRWKHIYCSYQNAYHQKMTPDHVGWSKVRKRDAYGVPAIFAAMGAAAILCWILCFAG